MNSGSDKIDIILLVISGERAVNYLWCIQILRSCTCDETFHVAIDKQLGCGLLVWKSMTSIRPAHILHIR
jgi:hypothetical protein